MTDSLDLAASALTKAHFTEEASALGRLGVAGFTSVRVETPRLVVLTSESPNSTRIATYELWADRCRVSIADLPARGRHASRVGKHVGPFAGEVLRSINMLMEFIGVPADPSAEDFDVSGGGGCSDAPMRHLEILLPDTAEPVFLADMAVLHFQGGARARSDVLAAAVCACLSRLEARLSPAFSESALPLSFRLAVGAPTDGDRRWLAHPHGRVYAIGMQAFGSLGSRSDLGYLSDLRTRLLEFQVGDERPLAGWTDWVDRAIESIERRE